MSKRSVRYVAPDEAVIRQHLQEIFEEIPQLVGERYRDPEVLMGLTQSTAYLSQLIAKYLNQEHKDEPEDQS